MGVVWLVSVVIEDEKGSKRTLKHYLPESLYTFDQAEAYAGDYLTALDGVIEGVIRKATITQIADLAGLKTEPLPTADVEEKLEIRYDTLKEDFIDDQWRQAKKSHAWTHRIPTFRDDLTIVWYDDSRVADQDLDAVRDLLRMMDTATEPHPAAACDDHGIRLNLALRTKFKFSRSRKGEGA